MITVDTKTGTISSGATAQSATTAKATTEMGQNDFLTLMLAQLQAQDPLNPMDNADFVAQLAQFSTVSGLEKINASVEALGSGMSDFRVASAANMLGRHVLVPGSVARADAMGGVHGLVDLPNGATSVVVTFSHGRTGELLKSIPYGPQPAGKMNFDWTDMPADLVADRTPVRIAVSATIGEGTKSIGAQVYARVTSATSGATGKDLTLQVEDYGAVNALEVDSIR